MSMTERVRVHAPATLSNLGPGFDVLGLAVERPGDYVEAEWSETPGVEIVEVRGETNGLTTDPTRNVVGIAATAALLDFDARKTDSRPPGVRLWLDKRMPLASGLGSSAASSVGGALAVSELLGGVFDRNELIACALEGERAVSGGVHADNVAPCVVGGIVLIRSYAPMELLSLPVPDALRVAVVHPHVSVVTAEARVLAVREVEAGDTAGYAATWAARGPARIAVLAAGYADGYFRSLSSGFRAGNEGESGGSVYIGGGFAPVAGRVSMDMAMVDISHLPEGAVKRGDWAELIGPHMSVDEVGLRAGTLGYEILTALGARYMRRYIEDGRESFTEDGGEA